MIPEEIKKQCSERMAVLNEMISNGTITTPAEYLETPVLLVLSMSDYNLAYQHKSMKRTRRRYIPFSLNGKSYLVKRKDAIALVVNEIEFRKNDSNNGNK